MISSSRLFIGFVAVASVAACGGSDGGTSAADQALAAAITADLDADDDAGFGEIFDTTCMGNETVAALGGAEAADEKYGYRVETVSEMEDVSMQRADAERVIAGYQKCGDFAELLKKSFTDVGVTEADAACVVDAIPSATLVESFVSSLVDPAGEEAVNTVFDDAATSCGLG